MKVLILGASGLLGSAAFRVLSEKKNWVVYGTVRGLDVMDLFPAMYRNRLVQCGDLRIYEELERLFLQINPDIVINCVSLAKEVLRQAELLKFISIYSLLPQRLLRLCSLYNARFIQISSDGVFSGKKGVYTEDDFPDADDIYGISKLLGEVSRQRAITLRTSIIGHELNSRNGLLEWFLAQENQCKCFTRAIFSGLPSVVLAQIIRDYVIPNADMSGIYHVGAKPISKFDLLTLIAEKYKKMIQILPDHTVSINRSLSANKFQQDTGYNAPEWSELIHTMYSYQCQVEEGNV